MIWYIVLAVLLCVLAIIAVAIVTQRSGQSRDIPPRPDDDAWSD